MQKLNNPFCIMQFLVISMILANILQSEQPMTNQFFIMGTNIPPQDIEKIVSAIPQTPAVKPIKPRKLLIFDLNVNYGGHPSAAYANIAFKMMGEKTAAFETIISHDKNIFKKETLAQFDAIFFNNNVGNLFEDADLRKNIVEFVYRGKGLMGVHAATVAFTKWPGAIEDWPEFGIMLGARGANHRQNTEHITINVEDPENPITTIFKGGSFQYKDEFFRFHQVYSRERVRVLLSINTNSIDASQDKLYSSTIRNDNDYALSWVRSYGKGRIFYSTIGHNPYVFYDPIMLRFYLNAVQFVLGDLSAPTTPSAYLNEKTLLYEKLNWNLGIIGNTNTQSIENLCQFAYSNSIHFAGIHYNTPVFNNETIRFNPDMSDHDREKYRLMLDKYRLQIHSCRINKLPALAAEKEKFFEFIDSIGIENLIVPANLLDNDTELLNYCRQFNINIVTELQIQYPEKSNIKNFQSTQNQSNSFAIIIPNQDYVRYLLSISNIIQRSSVFIIRNNPSKTLELLERTLMSQHKTKSPRTIFLIQYSNQ